MPLCPFPLKKERECKGKVKAHTSGAYPGFISMKHLEVLLLPSGRDASPLQGSPPTVCRRCSCPFRKRSLPFLRQKGFDLLWRLFLSKRKKIATQGQTWTSNSDHSYPSQSPLPLHCHTDPPKRRKI